MRFLLTIGGAGTQKDIFAAIIRTALASVKKGNMVLYVNLGDYMNVWEELVREIPAMESLVTTHFDDWSDTTAFADKALKEEVHGIHAFCHENIYEAVYCTNLLMRSCDVLITKPSELAFIQFLSCSSRELAGMSSGAQYTRRRSEMEHWSAVTYHTHSR